MGTELHCKSFTLQHYSMRDLNEDSNSSSWPLFYRDRNLANGHYCNGFMPRTIMDAYQGYDKDVLKQKMLEHEAIFRNQVCELHRLYRIQRDMMDEIKRKELYTNRMPFEASSSSTHLASQIPPEDARKWHIPNFPLANPGCARPSVSGAEIVSSPLSFTKGSSTQTGRVPYQNGCTSQDCEALESRPSKVRKKFFDLQLPADEYVDTEGEKFQDNEVYSITSFPPNKNHAVVPDNHAKFFLGSGATTAWQADASTADSCRKSSTGLADLNEPIQIEEGTVSASVDLLGCIASHVEFRGVDLSAKPQSQFLGLPKDILWRSQKRSNGVSMPDVSIENKGNGRERLTYKFESGNSKNQLNSAPQGFPQDKSLMPQLMANTSGSLLNDHSGEDLWRERIDYHPEPTDGVRDHSNYNYSESFVASRVTSPYPLVNSSNLGNSWCQSVASWGKTTSSLTQKLTSVQPLPFSTSTATLNRYSQSSAQSYENFGDRWHISSSCRLIPGLRNEVPNQNGFCHGSSSGSKEVLHHAPLTSGFENLKCNSVDNVASVRPIDHASGRYSKGSELMDLKPVQDVNLNVALPRNTSDEAAPLQCHEIRDGKRKSEDRVAVLPWLRPKSACKNEVNESRRDSNTLESGFLQASSSNLCKNETLRGSSLFLTQTVTSASSDSAMGAKKEIVDHAPKKILGFTIFENPCTSKNDSSSLGYTSASLQRPTKEEDKKVDRRTTVIDINLSCDPMAPENGIQIAAEALFAEEIRDSKVAALRSHIDLNSCVTEDEDQLPLVVESTSAKLKVTLEIDLEAPVVLESEEDILHDQNCIQSPQHISEETQDEVARIAAEAIVAISSSTKLNDIEGIMCNLAEDSAPNSLLWFVDIVSSCAEEIENKFDKETEVRDGNAIKQSSPEEIDYFEAMTLLLTETREEDYMPKPLVPEVLKFEETGPTSVSNRTRKGLARRGRQRRDFQRDILPGLTSLSRHEVTEDLQIFGGLMRATGHPWNSGMTRRNGTRNGAGRGRRRAVTDATPPVVSAPVCAPPLVQQLNNIEARLEDRSLTGWGKTTRRPRRQRCPAE